MSYNLVMARKDETEIDSRFFVPENIVDVRRNNSYDDDFDYSTIVDPANPEAYPSPEPNFERLPAPLEGITIVSQVVKISPDGTTRIDVVLEMPDQPQNVEYETQITKIA